MAENIFNEHDYRDIVERLHHLDPTHERNWGRMDIVQTLKHCAVQLELGLGIIKPSAFEGSPIMRTGLGRWLFLYVAPWPRGWLPTPTKMNMLERNTPVAEFESERGSLLRLLERVQTTQDLLPHPFFGALNRKDWGRLIWKHLDHHLKQFAG